MWEIKNGVFSIIDKNTNEVVLNSVPVSSPTIEYSISYNTNPTTTLTMENCEFSQEALNAIFGFNRPLHRFDIELSAIKIIQVQARKHKKWRINKKWLKRYGYKDVKVPINFKMDNCMISQDNYDKDCYSIVGEVSNYKEGCEI